jgi:DNA-3-methyladenine glycosylase I
MNRCEWAGGGELERAYHDEEWGVPVHDDRRLFEFLILEGAQAGLSWSTVLKKREGYRKAFRNFDAGAVSRFSEGAISRLLADPGIIRNRLKVRAAVDNAKAFLRVRSEFGSFDDYIWRFVDGDPVRNAWTSMAEIPCSTPVSDALSKDLRNRGFKFVGSKICYAFMQAVGMVNDHVVECFRYRLCTPSPSGKARTTPCALPRAGGGGDPRRTA